MADRRNTAAFSATAAGAIGTQRLGGVAAAMTFVLPVILAAAIGVLFIPVSPDVLDLLLTANITVSVLLLLGTLTIRTPMELSLFPTLLLVTTLVRLVLNVATTRQILTDAPTAGLDAAGQVVRSFGDFVAGGEPLVGLVIFAIIVIIQFVVITKGTTRISEVAARFTLDAMPGRQMSIDADLAAGFIDDAEARRRRDAISRQADFFGAMDGASKFVRGDAVAGILITLINIFGGLIIGVLRHGMSITDASEIFTRLTIGDGLVSQVPALLISLAAGVLVTRSSEPIQLSTAMTRQLMLRPGPLFMTGGLLLALLFTGLSAKPLLLLGGGCILFGVWLRRHPSSDESETASVVVTNAQPAASSGDTQSGTVAATANPVGRADAEATPTEATVETLLAVDPMELELGVALVPLADQRSGGDLLERVQKIRRMLAAELGIIVPKVRIRDHMQLPPKHYRIRIDDVPVAEDSLEPRSLLALDPGNASGTLPGVPTRDPAFGTPALWITPDHADQARSLGFTVVDPSSALSTHLTQLIRAHAAELLSRDSVQLLLDELRRRSPAAVEGIVPEKVSVGLLGQVLRLLLVEQVSIRPLARILEALGDAVEHTRSPQQLVAAVRVRLAPMLSAKYRDASGTLSVITLDPTLEERMAAWFHDDGTRIEWFAPPEFRREFCRRTIAEFEHHLGQGRLPVLLASAATRAAVRQLTLGELPDLVVMCAAEISHDTRIERAGEVADWSASPRATTTVVSGAGAFDEFAGLAGSPSTMAFTDDLSNDARLLAQLTHALPTI